MEKSTAKLISFLAAASTVVMCNYIALALWFWRATVQCGG